LLHVVQASTGMNLNWLRVSQPGSPYGGKPWPVPGKFEAEDFDVGGENVGYHAPGGDPTVLYRATGVRLESCSDAGGGFDVRDTQRNDWLAYTIDVQATTSYRLTARVANTLGDSDIGFGGRRPSRRRRHHGSEHRGQPDLRRRDQQRIPAHRRRSRAEARVQPRLRERQLDQSRRR
jgi:hypothetical protein